MGHNSQDTSDVFNYFLELRKPTEEDLKRVFSEEELKELCLKQKCRVDIWRWNLADDYRTLFTESGRYQKWSERDRLRMLAKAVNKIKPPMYNENEVRKIREEEWKFQLKENILSLNYWKRQSLKASKSTESVDIDPDLQLQCEVNTESINTPELLTASQRHELLNMRASQRCEEELQQPIEVDTESENVDKQSNRKSVISENQSTTPHIIRPITIETDFEEEYLTDEDCGDSRDTVILIGNSEKTCRKILQPDEIAPEIDKIYGVNTLSMSMNIDSQFSTQSQDLRPIQSEDVIPASYDNFRNIIPMTSTQSQEI